MKVREIFEKINKIIPVSTQEKWDNSGFLVGDEEKEVEKTVFALDITKGAVEFAIENKADLIISHHPVIFEPLKDLKKDSIVYKLVENDISAICMHTPLDIAECGMNEILFRKFSDEISIEKDYKILEETQPDGTGFGFVAKLKKPLETGIFAKRIAKSLAESDVRFYGGRKEVSVFAVCSGSGSSMLEYAKNLGADTLITGDVKHDRWVAAENLEMNIIDAGHFGTEKFFYEPIFKLLKNYAECLKYEKKPYETINYKAGE